MVNEKILKFDVNKDVGEIRFNHWIMKKESYARLNEGMRKGLFEMTIRQIEEDLGITFGRARGLIKKFEELGIIKVQKRAKSKIEVSIYSYEYTNDNE